VQTPTDLNAVVAAEDGVEQRLLIDCRRVGLQALYREIARSTPEGLTDETT
jgi:hypothetical protein